MTNQQLADARRILELRGYIRPDAVGISDEEIERAVSPCSDPDCIVCKGKSLLVPNSSLQGWFHED